MAARKQDVRKRVARPDAPDFRDRLFQPLVAEAPPLTLFPRVTPAVKNQEDTNACTGFSLSTVLEYLLIKSKREKAPLMSPYMLYSMARRYDEFPGSVEDEGSSLRGALKGWFKHGACRDDLWTTGVNMPNAPKSPSQDWWLDAVKRPLGAYYRIDCKVISDMHAALNEVGILYASAACHAGWDEGGKVKRPKARPRSFATPVWPIPPRRAAADDGGHAFAIVGYNEQGFLIQNSWGNDWGTWGYAVLAYDDWFENAMDCWAVQLGVATEEHNAISGSQSLRTDKKGAVTLSASDVLRDRELSPFIVNVGNNGKLSNSGVFRTQPDDLRAIVDVHLAAARQRWGLGNGPMDVCIYAHGGLVGEKEAAKTAAKWIPLLYDSRIFPVFIMWETDFLSTVIDRLSDAIADVPRTTGAGFWSRVERWWNRRLERTLARPGTQIWGEMKQNADAISAGGDSGAVMLYQHFKEHAAANPIRMHLVGHSAGSIVHSWIVKRLGDDGMAFESMSFLAPAVRVKTFDDLVRPRIADGTVKRYQQFHLSDQAEEKDPTCSPYRRSLLYLVSESFEGGTQTPILGMQKFFDPYKGNLQNIVEHVAPGPTSGSTTHGGFDDDAATQQQVIKFIKQAGG